MRGFAIPLVGILLLIVVTASYAILVQSGTAKIFIAADSERAVSLSHETELTRKMMDESIPIVAYKAAFDLGKEGGGLGSKWTKDYPSKDDLAEKYQSAMETYFPSTTIPGNLESTEIAFSKPEIKVTEYHDSSFKLKMNYTATLTDSKISASSFLNVSDAEYGISSKYFGAIGIGRSLIESDYLKNSVINGIGSVPGLASLTPNDIAEEVARGGVIEAKLSSVATKMKEDQENSHSGFEFTFTPTFTRENNKIFVTLDIVIDTEQILPPSDKIALDFTTDFEHDVV